MDIKEFKEMCKKTKEENDARYMRWYKLWEEQKQNGLIPPKHSYVLFGTDVLSCPKCGKKLKHIHARDADHINSEFIIFACECGYEYAA